MVTETKKIDYKRKGVILDSLGRFVDKDGEIFSLDKDVFKHFSDLSFDISISSTEKSELDD